MEAHHDGRLNTYTINFKGEKVAFLSLSDSVQDQKDPKNLFLGEKEFLKNVKEEGTPFNALVVLPKDDRAKKVQEEVKPLKKVGPKEVADLLDLYKDIVTKELPSELPPIREISHNIDLIPIEILLNNVYYKLTLKQNREMARHIQELLDKGLITKILSPCVVPSLL